MQLNRIVKNIYHPSARHRKSHRRYSFLITLKSSCTAAAALDIFGRPSGNDSVVVARMRGGVAREVSPGPRLRSTRNNIVQRVGYRSELGARQAQRVRAVRRAFRNYRVNTETHGRTVALRPGHRVTCHRCPTFL